MIIFKKKLIKLLRTKRITVSDMMPEDLTDKEKGINAAFLMIRIYLGDYPEMYEMEETMKDYVKKE